MDFESEKKEGFASPLYSGDVAQPFVSKSADVSQETEPAQAPAQSPVQSAVEQSAPEINFVLKDAETPKAEEQVKPAESQTEPNNFYSVPPQEPKTWSAPAPQPIARPGISRRNFAVLAIILVIACAASGVGGAFIGANIWGGSTVVSGSGESINITTTSDVGITEAVAQKVMPSVVGITSTGTIVSEDFFFGQREQEVSGVGTGMIIDEKGYVLTNSHVVMDGSVDSISVLLNSGDEVEGKVIWNDSSLDLAIVKIEAKGLQAVEIAKSSDVQIGSYVAAIGNPLGIAFKSSITQGVVSGLDRTITVSDSTTGTETEMEGLIQVDAAINSGNSGGPLLNSKGQVIGVNTAKAGDGAEGMGFAIPIDTAAPIIEKVIKDGTFERVYMGVSAADVSTIKENYPNVKLYVDEGACITEVNSGSPAEKAGLKIKDVITAIDGQAVTGSADLIKKLLVYSSGDKVLVTYDREGKTEETELTLVSQSEIQQIEEEENPFKPQTEEQQGGGSYGW